ncbi:MAG: FkbM family methyltransferase [Bacteroidota bacterium]|nr:FkbM family methyltransferase [Bacteroidota bacterium]
MNKAAKIFTNVLTPRAFSVLGPKMYAAYFERILTNTPQILRDGDFRSVDREMGSIARRFRYRNSVFTYDCRFCDEHIDEDTYAFGNVRELYIRDCYLRHHPAHVYEKSRVVVDVGANRGAFSALMTTRATFILSIECNPVYAPVISHNIRENGFTNHALEIAFIGRGENHSRGSHAINIVEAFSRYGIEKADFVKIDIEGSEFELFDDTDWLHRVHALSMEVHPEHGDPSTIIRHLRDHGFRCLVADENLRLIPEKFEKASFLYAVKNET